MKRKKETNFFSAVTIWLQGFSVILVLQNVVAAFMMLFLYTSANIPFNNPSAIIFLVIYGPLCVADLISMKKMREGDIQGGKIALYLDSILILLCSIDIVLDGWGLSEQFFEFELALMILNILVVFLLSATSAKELRLPKENEMLQSGVV